MSAPPLLPRARVRNDLRMLLRCNAPPPETDARDTFIVERRAIRALCPDSISALETLPQLKDLYPSERWIRPVRNEVRSVPALRLDASLPGDGSMTAKLSQTFFGETRDIVAPKEGVEVDGVRYYEMRWHDRILHPLPDTLRIDVDFDPNERESVKIKYPRSIDFQKDANLRSMCNACDFESKDGLPYDLVCVQTMGRGKHADRPPAAYLRSLDDGWITVTAGPESGVHLCYEEEKHGYSSAHADRAMSGISVIHVVTHLWYRQRRLEKLARSQLETHEVRESHKERLMAALTLQCWARAKRIARVHNKAVARGRRKQAEFAAARFRRLHLWAITASRARRGNDAAKRLQRAWRGWRARKRVAHFRELKRRHDALEDAEVAAAREKALARRRLAEQSREARQRELPAPLPSHAASTLGNHGKKDGKDRAAVRSVEQAQEHADWTSEAGRQSRTRHGEQTKAEAHAAAVARKREQKRQAERQKEIDAGKREAERLERRRLESRTPKSVDEALNEAAAYARAHGRQK